MKRIAGLALLLPLLAAAAQAGPGSSDLELRLSSGSFRPRAASVPVPSWFDAESVETSASGQRYLVAILDGPLEPLERRRLEATGATLLDYLPVHGYRLRLAPQDEAAARALPFVAWLGELHPSWKVSRELATRAERPGEPARVRVVVSAGEPVARVMAALAGLVATAAPSGKDGAWRVEVTLPGGRLAQDLSRVAALPEVEAIEPVRPLRLTNQDAVWVHQSFVGPSPQQAPIFTRGIFGCGQIVGIADSGQDYDSCFFRDTVNGAPPIVSCGSPPCPEGTPAPNRRKDILYYNWSGTPTGDDDTCPSLGLGASGHGTHTSGSIAGDNSTYANCTTFANAGRTGGDGQAPGAKLVVQEMGDGLEYLNDLGGTLWNLADVAYRNGARLHSDSWAGVCQDALGSCIPGCEIPYDSFARDADLAMWTYPDLLLVLAAGNAGDFCAPPIAVGTPAIAKSPVSVGAVGHGAGAGAPSSFSSRGPVFDGRLKPTLAAQGESTVSAASDAVPTSNSCGTCLLDGTSMATPTVAGFGALVREYYTAGFYKTGARNPAEGLTPSGALVKATLIDGAVALGAPAPDPDFDSGYGRVLLGSTLAFTGGGFQLRVDDRREGIGTGGVVTHAYDVAAGTPFRATLVWSDFPAALGAAIARVNELKLEVIDPSGNVWFQTLDAGTGAPVRTMDPGDAHDTLNVEERLVFEAPAPGRWVVRVLGVDVPWGPQPFALVVRGALADCASPAAPGAPVLGTPSDGAAQVSWSAVPGALAYNVYRSFGACPGGPFVPVATAVAGTSFLDTSVSGGVTYSYTVTAASDVGAFCESAPSPCAAVVPTGDCVLAPEFRGIVAAASAGSDSCTIELLWDAATPRCGPDMRYNVYRGTSPGFVPGPATRIARCIAGTSYTDSRALAHGTTYHYAVRAEDATAGHGGPCRDGNEDANVARAAAAPDGPPALGDWIDDAGDAGSAKLAPVSPWMNAPSGGNTGPKVYTVASFAGLCANLTSPALTLGDPGKGPQLSFATRHDLEYDPLGILGAEGSLGQVEVATGPAFTDWTRVALTPDYPAFVEFPFNDCPTTANPDTYFSGTEPAYVSHSASLGNWAGGEAKIRFHISGDYLYPSGNWWIDDVTVTQALVPGACVTLAAGPPPIPDGASVPGTPLRASRSGAQVLLSWDASRCPATAVNVYRGAIGGYASFTSGSCALAPTGSAVVSMPDNAWFLVVATDGSATDGSHSRDGAGAEKSYGGASLACPAITAHVTNNDCP